jgi:hypothetical protein
MTIMWPPFNYFFKLKTKERKDCMSLTSHTFPKQNQKWLHGLCSLLLLLLLLLLCPPATLIQAQKQV